jgi:hypothetical protein
MTRPTTAPDGIERLRRAKRHLADFDSELADARTADAPLTVTASAFHSGNRQGDAVATLLLDEADCDQGVERRPPQSS